jgi:hypothetical protein
VPEAVVVDRDYFAVAHGHEVLTEARPRSERRRERRRRRRGVAGAAPRRSARARRVAEILSLAWRRGGEFKRAEEAIPGPFARQELEERRVEEEEEDSREGAEREECVGVARCLRFGEDALKEAADKGAVVAHDGGCNREAPFRALRHFLDAARDARNLFARCKGEAGGGGACECAKKQYITSADVKTYPGTHAQPLSRLLPPRSADALGSGSSTVGAPYPPYGPARRRPAAS